MQILRRPLGLVLIVAYNVFWGIVNLAAAGYLGHLLKRAPDLIGAHVADDPQNLLMSWLLAHVPLQPEHVRLVGVTLLVVGLLKLALAAGIWFRLWVVRDLALVLFALAGLVAAGALVAHFTAFRLVALGIDLVIVWYLWRKLPEYLPPRRAPAPRLAV